MVLFRYCNVDDAFLMLNSLCNRLGIYSINSLPVVVYGEAGNELAESECYTCLGVFVEGDKVKKLWECVDRWLQSSCTLSG